MSSPYRPQLFASLRAGYTRAHLVKDIFAGAVVGVVALPLAIAFAIASGCKPEQGLYTAIVAGFIISFLGGSKVQIGGPTGAFVALVFGVMSRHGYEGLALATLVAGLMIFFLGVAKLGSLIQFIPYPVTVGFTAGIAVIIFTGQIGDLFGLQIEKLPAPFFDKIDLYIERAETYLLPAALIGIGTIVLLKLWPRVSIRVPGSLVALIVTTLIVQIFGLEVETIGSRFGEIPTRLPAPSFPAINLAVLRDVFSDAIAIALLGSIESLLSAVVADGMIGSRHNSNTELVAQGVANMVSPLFGGLPATGAIARTATNVRNGAVSPVSGLVHSVVLLLIMLFFGRWAELIPMATLAGILVVVAHNMGEWRLFAKILHSSRADATVLLITFTLTVVIDLVVAIQFGVILAAFLFMKRMADVTQVGISLSGDEVEETNDPDSITLRRVPKGVRVFEINGPFFFGAVDKFRTTVAALGVDYKIVIVRMRAVPAVDMSGLNALESFISSCHKKKIPVILSGLRDQPMSMLYTSGLIDLLGERNACRHIDQALARAHEILSHPHFAER